ncbi:MAG: hypothetical protein AAFZ15_24950 [Bacteroidota bacterium]
MADNVVHNFCAALQEKAQKEFEKYLLERPNTFEKLMAGNVDFPEDEEERYALYDRIIKWLILEAVEHDDYDAAISFLSDLLKYVDALRGLKEIYKEGED